MNNMPYYDENNGQYDEWPLVANEETLDPLPQGEVA